MAKVFLLYMPLGNREAMVHYEDTIRNKVPLERITPHISQNIRAKLDSVFRGASIAAWGSEAGPKNRANFEQMSEGDDVLIVEGDTIKLIGKIAAKVESEGLSRILWQPLGGNGKVDWRLIYFIASPRELDVPFEEFCGLFGYERSYRLRGFTTVARSRLKEFYSRYDDLYSVLVRIQEGRPVAQRQTGDLAPLQPPELVPVSLSEVDEALNAQVGSEHTLMQLKLARLGIKAGERVWVPVGDQSKLRSAFDFTSFDPQFAAGIDLPHSYIENIDVVWKQEFRIGAAYEIENSTSIYSGLLRFADLNIVAPNTLYPMFVVAPRSRKNRLLQQLRRPTFRQLELHQKVRFLAYETINEIDEFFARDTAGLSVDLILGKSETVV